MGGEEISLFATSASSDVVSERTSQSTDVNHLFLPVNVCSRERSGGDRRQTGSTPRKRAGRWIGLLPMDLYCVGAFPWQLDCASGPT